VKPSTLLLISGGATFIGSMVALAVKRKKLFKTLLIASAGLAGAGIIADTLGK